MNPQEKAQLLRELRNDAVASDNEVERTLRELVAAQAQHQLALDKRKESWLEYETWR